MYPTAVLLIRGSVRVRHRLSKCTTSAAVDWCGARQQSGDGRDVDLEHGNPRIASRQKSRGLLGSMWRPHAHNHFSTLEQPSDPGRQQAIRIFGLRHATPWRSSQYRWQCWCCCKSVAFFWWNDFFIVPHPREADFFGVRVFRAEVAHAAKANLRRPDPSARVQPAFVQPRPTPVYPAWHEAQRRCDVRRVP